MCVLQVFNIGGNALDIFVYVSNLQLILQFPHMCAAVVQHWG